MGNRITMNRRPFRMHRRPLLFTGEREDGAVETLGSTGGPISPFGTTVINATKANMVYTLPPPQAGMRKRIYVNYTGNADDLVIAGNSTADLFNGSGTANTIVVSSSMTTIGIKLYGLSTNRWGALYSGPAISTSLIFENSTIKSSTDRTG